MHSSVVFNFLFLLVANKHEFFLHSTRISSERLTFTILCGISGGGQCSVAVSLHGIGRKQSLFTLCSQETGMWPTLAIRFSFLGLWILSKWFKDITIPGYHSSWGAAAVASWSPMCSWDLPLLHPWSSQGWFMVFSLLLQATISSVIFSLPKMFASDEVTSAVAYN